MEKCKTVIFAMPLGLAFQLDSLLKKINFTAITWHIQSKMLVIYKPDQVGKG